MDVLEGPLTSDLEEALRGAVDAIHGGTGAFAADAPLDGHREVDGPGVVGSAITVERGVATAASDNRRRAELSRISPGKAMRSTAEAI